MGRKRVLVGYGIDVDAVANWINTCDGSPQNPTNVSRGIYGATVGIDRLLKLYQKYDIKATFFTPAHSIESFPTQLAKVRDAGHEIGLHGYTHEYESQLSANGQQKVLTRSIDVLTKFCGKRPIGYTAPSWSTSREMIAQLEAEGILYDHSFMHHDVQPYWAPDNRQTWPSEVVEIPANWHLDDWPPLQPIPGRAGAQGFVDTHTVEKLWLEQFDFAYRGYDTFIFPISLHPQVSGKPQVILMHGRIIEYINKHDGVEWMPLGDMAKEFAEGRFPGVEVEGGVDL
ncbi:glucose 1-dehydrogenase [Teratosphaeria nubilosa]|uniref:Glucose 1-dehydrogenase n=1 Tax=Teratosphaeria nubilosa TaxID=161662 RepID=A0A6G1L0H9_9PEZI|nr:glucose 1-dehydrogenase [Teratosphaeria nubilosa]